ncbi:MAG: spore maturation protein, partial [bacterium]|nr:spore maturation protein [bacterium]
AMEELDKLNKKKGVATNAMALFLAINSSNVALLPLGAIAIRAAAGSTNPGSIIITTLMATTCSTVVAVLAVKLLQCLPRYRLVGEEVVLQQDVSPSLEEESEKEGDNHASVPALVRWTTLLLFFGAVVWGIFSYLQNTTLPLSDAVQTILSQWLLLLLMGGILVWGLMKQVKVYESLIEGAKEGFQVAIRIIPFLVAILVAVGMFRASGGLEFLISLISPLTNLIGMPAETLPMAILRPLTGSGAFGVMTETLKTYGPDSLIGNIVSTMQGSTETTFYIFAVYCGAIGVKNVRHALPACLLADAAGFLAAVYACRWLLG